MGHWWEEKIRRKSERMKGDTGEMLRKMLGERLRKQEVRSERADNEDTE